jgi:hypothetical protein
MREISLSRVSAHAKRADAQPLVNLCWSVSTHFRRMGHLINAHRPSLYGGSSSRRKHCTRMRVWITMET